MEDFHFIISAPRSGSTWLTRALNFHPQVIATENRLFGMFCEVWQNANGRSAPRITADQYLRTLSNHSFFSELGFDSAAELQSELLDEYISFLADFLRTRSGKSVVVDKITPYLGTSQRVVSEIQSRFPHAKVVHLIRDGRDVATSGVFDWITRQNLDSDRYQYFVAGKRDVPLRRFFDDELIGDWARYWSEPIAAVQQSEMAALVVQYEAMLQNQGDVLDSLFDHLGLSTDSELIERAVVESSFAKTTGRREGDERPLEKARKGIAGDWRNYFTKRDAELFAELTKDFLSQLGYETDSSWIESCPDELDLGGD